MASHEDFDTNLKLLFFKILLHLVLQALSRHFLKSISQIIHKRKNHGGIRLNITKLPQGRTIREIGIT